MNIIKSRLLCENLNLDKLCFPAVCKGWVLLLILVESMLGIDTVHAEVAEGGPEEVVLGTVLQQVGLQSRSCSLINNITAPVWSKSCTCS